MKCGVSDGFTNAKLAIWNNLFDEFSYTKGRPRSENSCTKNYTHENVCKNAGYRVNERAANRQEFALFEYFIALLVAQYIFNVKRPPNRYE